MEVKKLIALLTLVVLTFAAPTDSDHDSLLAGQNSNHARSVLDLTALEQNLTLSSRQPPAPPMFQQLCMPIAGQTWDVANQLTILSGISYLRNVGIQCNTGPGPGNCVRVSCSYDAAIYLCNDDPNKSLYIDCNEVADYAQNINDDCQSPYWCGKDTCDGCGGQQFSSENWNVIVRWDSC